jgi:hypothetical protein
MLLAARCWKRCDWWLVICVALVLPRPRGASPEAEMENSGLALIAHYIPLFLNL